MKTLPDLLAALRAVDPKTTEKQAYRFCAWVEATTATDSNSLRDWVDLFVEGFPGFKKPEHVAELLASLDEDKIPILIKEFLR